MLEPKDPGQISLVRVLGEGVHTDPLAAYRELVDRAAEACARRSAIDPQCTPAILVSTQSLGGVTHVSVTDNGEAFDADAFRELFSVIQTGRIGAVKRALAMAGASGAADVVGRFGAALMAAFLLADRVSITACNGAGAVKFTCDSRTYAIEPTTSARLGTTVQLRVRKDRAAFATVERIREALLDHARLRIDVPVRIGSDPTPINTPAA